MTRRSSGDLIVCMLRTRNKLYQVRLFEIQQESSTPAHYLFNLRQILNRGKLAYFSSTLQFMYLALYYIVQYIVPCTRNYRRNYRYYILIYSRALHKTCLKLLNLSYTFTAKLTQLQQHQLKRSILKSGSHETNQYTSYVYIRIYIYAYRQSQTQLLLSVQTPKKCK